MSEEIIIHAPSGTAEKLAASAFRLNLEVDALLREAILIAADAGTTCAFRTRDRVDVLLSRMGSHRDD
jgi:hypothetical protein